MFSFDLSMVNVILLAGIVVLVIIFITILMKLNPSTEKKETLKTETKVERQKPPEISPIAAQTPPPAKIDVPRVTERPPVAVSPTIGGASLQTSQETPAPTRSESREIPKPEKTVTPAKTDTASSKRDCLHYFGYLRTVPKNAPIPDECFGCPKIVECLVKAKAR